MNNKETVIYQGDSKWSRNAYIKFVGDKIVFDCSDGEYGPIEFDIQMFYDAELKHAQDIDNDWDVTLMDGLENEPYVSDDFQIGPDGAYEDVEYSISIIDEAYENYKKIHKHAIRTEGDRGETAIQMLEEQLIYTKEVFINKCKTNPELFKGWGLKIEERKLSLEERYNIWFNNNYETGMERYFDPNKIPNFDDQYYTSTPTKLITITYNDKTIESYE
jgi:hypothetical protein